MNFVTHPGIIAAGIANDARSKISLAHASGGIIVPSAFCGCTIKRRLSKILVSMVGVVACVRIGAASTAKRKITLNRMARHFIVE